MKKSSKALDTALRLLANREHSAQELGEKLSRKGYLFSEIQDILSHLKAENLQSDSRFAESYIRSRKRRGYGPNYIKQALAQKGVEPLLVNNVLDELAIDWSVEAYQVWLKKYGPPQKEQTAKDALKQKRFLYYRGFDGDIIASVFRRLSVIES